MQWNLKLFEKIARKHFQLFNQTLLQLAAQEINRPICLFGLAAFTVHQLALSGNTCFDAMKEH